MRIFLTIFSTLMLTLPAMAQPISDYTLPPGTSAANVVKNVDGSITIIQPTVWLQGMQVGLSLDSDTTTLCGMLLGRRSSTVKSITTRQQNLLPVVKFGVTAQGVQRFDEAKRETMIGALTCNQ